MIVPNKQISLERKILESLAPGCARGDVVLNEVKSHDSSEVVCTQALHKLRKERLIKSKRYAPPGTHGAYVLYALTEDGAACLAENWKYKIDEIRTSLPAINTAAHEVAVTDVVRTIRWERLHIPYTGIYHDDVACKQNKKHLDLTGWVPDLLLLITRIKNIPYPDPYRLAIEIDMGSRKLADVLRTVSTRNDISLFLCSTSERIDAIRSELERYSDLQEMVYFALLSDFCSKPGGVFMTEWMDLSGAIVSLYPE